MVEIEMPDGSVIEFPDDTPPDVMKETVGRASLSTASQQLTKPEDAPEVDGPKGYMTDPTEDRKAWEAAKARFESKEKSWVGDTNNPSYAASVMKRGAASASLNFDRPINAAISKLSGEGSFEFGKAKDRYYDEMVAKRAGAAGDAASLAGNIIPMALAPELSLPKMVAMAGGASAMEGHNLDTQNEGGDMRNATIDFLTGGAGAAIPGGLGAAVKSPIISQLLGKIPGWMKGAAGAGGAFASYANPTAGIPALIGGAVLGSETGRNVVGSGLKRIAPGIGRTLAKTINTGEDLPQSPAPPQEPEPVVEQTPNVTLPYLTQSLGPQEREAIMRLLQQGGR